MCTSITIKSKDGHYFFGRTLDFFPNFYDDDSPLKPRISIYPKGTQLHGQLEDWEAKYAVGGIGIKGSVAMLDGINDAGLAGELNVLEECTWADQAEIEAAGQKPLMAEEVITYFLSHFKTVAEIKAHIKEFALADVDFAPAKNSDLMKRIASHYTFVDPSGDGIVLEPVNHGRFKVYTSIGVMTNSPEYDWQITNLRNYVQLQGYNVGNPTLAPTLNNSDVLLKQIGYGSGLLGLPGDYTSTSRFVRAAFLSRFIDDFDSQDGINVLFSTYTTVMVPKGVEKVTKTSTDSDSTQYWSGYDLSERTFYIKPYDTNRWTRKKLSDFDQEAHFEISHENIYA